MDSDKLKEIVLKEYQKAATVVINCEKEIQHGQIVYFVPVGTLTQLSLLALPEVRPYESDLQEKAKMLKAMLSREFAAMITTERGGLLFGHPLVESEFVKFPVCVNTKTGRSVAIKIWELPEYAEIMK